MWKPLSIASGAVLLAAGGITYTQVRPDLIGEKTEVSNAKENLVKAQTNLSNAEKAKSAADTALKASEASLTKFESEKTAAAAKKDETAKAVEAETAVKDAASKELTDLELRMKDIGGVDAMVAELKKQEETRAKYESQISDRRSGIASAVSRKASTDKLIADLKRLDLWQKSGTMDASFSSRVTAVNPDWGFVTIGAGNSSRVVKQAKLDVIRGGTAVGKVIVTHVSPGQSVAEIVQGSVAPGDSILPGDVVRVGEGSKPAAPTTQPVAPAAKPAAGGAKPAAAEPADPFATPDAAAPAATETPAAPAADAPAATETPAAPASDAPAAPPEEPKVEKPAEEPAMSN